MASRAAMVREEYPAPKNEASTSGVSWPAVFAGAFSIGALGLILMALGAGVGLSSLSPWPNAGASAAGLSTGAIVWLIFVQIAASAFGGYLTGRLRTKWVSVHVHEVYFRDTANGMLAWAVAFVLSSLLFAFYATTIVAADRTITPAATQATGANAYFVDMLFRSGAPANGAAAATNDQAVRAEAAAILAHALLQPDVSAQDKTYLTNLVAATTGLPQPEAEQRVTDTLTADRQAVDTARKAAAHSLYWLFVALLIGAFCASFAATIGGRQRDLVPVSV